jgi:hypothetical protein
MDFRRIFSGILAFCLFGLAVLPSALASRPYLATESAVPIDRGKTRLEVGFSKENFDRDRDHYVLLSELTFGVINNMHFEVEVPYRFLRLEDGEDEDGLGDVKLKSKVRFIKGREANPLSMAGQISVKIPFCDEDKALSPECTGEPDVELTGIASKEFFPVTVDLNLGWVYVGNPPGQALDDVFLYSLAFDIQTVIEALRVVAELAGDSNRNPDANRHIVSVLGGLIYDVTLDLAIDLGIAVGLTEADETPDYGLSFGLSLLF